MEVTIRQHTSCEQSEEGHVVHSVKEIYHDIDLFDQEFLFIYLAIRTIIEENGCWK